MGLEELKLKIDKESELSASQIEEEGKAQARSVLDDAKTQCQKQRSIFREETNELLANQEKRTLADAAFESKRRVLLRKKEMLDEVLVAARQKAAKGKTPLQNLLKVAQKSMKVATVYVNPKDNDKVQGVTVKDANIIGGLIAENADGTMRIDLSFDSFLEQAWSESVSDVVKVLLE